MRRNLELSEKAKTIQYECAPAFLEFRCAFSESAMKIVLLGGIDASLWGIDASLMLYDRALADKATAVVADALPSMGRARASAGRRLAPLRARPAALGVSVSEQQSHYCDTEQNKTDRAHAVLPVHLFVRPMQKARRRRRASQ